MSRTIRVFWPQQTSGWKNFNWAGVIDKNSVVHISASEATVHQTLFGALDAIDRFRGEAGIFVKNVTPHGDQGGGGGVEFYLQVDWGSPLNVATDISVDEPAEQAFIVG